MAKPSYEECRRNRIEENKKRMEALNLSKLSQSLRSPSFKPSTPNKSASKPRNLEKTVVVVRRSGRLTNKPAPVYQEMVIERPTVPRRVSRGRSMTFALATYGARTEALEKAEKLESSLGTDFPTFVKSMLPSHVSGGFWLGLTVHFCKTALPKHDDVITLIDEKGDEYPTIYLARKTGLSGGWKGFAVAHDLADGDALVFQLIRPTTFKVYIVRVNGSEETNQQ